MENHKSNKSLSSECGNKVRKSHPFTFWYSFSFFSRSRRNTLFRAYEYFRWVDDYIDDKKTLTKDAKRLLSREIRLISTLYSHKPITPTYIFEEYISSVISEDYENRNGMQEIINGFFCALSWDVRRRNRIPTAKELTSYSQYLGCSYSQGITYGLNYHPTDSRFLEVSNNCGVAAHITHMLRDFFIDLEIGYINISKEDIEKYHINLSSNRQDLKMALSPWCKDQFLKTQNLFNQGLNSINKLPGFRARFAFRLISIRYLLILKKVKRDWE